MYFTSTPKNHFGQSTSKFKALGTIINILHSPKKSGNRGEYEFILLFF